METPKTEMFKEQCETCVGLPDSELAVDFAWPTDFAQLLYRRRETLKTRHVL